MLGEPPLSPILQRVVQTANSSLDTDDVLEQLARLTLEAIPGDRCATFLLDQQGRLVPAMAVGRVPNEDEWKRFQKTGPIELKGDLARWQAFSEGRAIYFPDLAESPLVPPEFVESFGARRALVMPLGAQGEPLGLLSIDWSIPGQDCSEQDIALVEAIGAYVGLAIRNARLYEGVSKKATTLERLVDLAAALNSTGSLTSVLNLVCAAFEDLVGTNMCSIEVVDSLAPQGIRTAAARGRSSISGAIRHANQANETIDPESPDGVHLLHEMRVSAYPDLRQQPLPKQFKASPKSGSAVVFPLWRPDGALGWIVATFRARGTPSEETLATGHALAELAATAISRANLHHELQGRLQRVEILHRLSDVVAGSADLEPALRKLNGLLPNELGIRLESISIANAQLRNALGAPAPSDQELEALRSWRAIIAKGRTPPRPKRLGEQILVPLVHHKRALGVLSVSVKPEGREPVDEELLAAIASGCAEVVYKSGLHRELAESERRLAVVAERERIARDLHDSVGQLLTGLGMQLGSYARDTEDPSWKERLEELRDLAGRGSIEIREAIKSLLFLDVRREGLTRSLRELARRFSASTGIEASFRISGNAVSLATVAEDALFRVAHEGLMNAERHSDASAVAVVLTYDRSGVTVSVTDDGIGLGDNDPFIGGHGRFGIRGLQRLLEEVGGELELWNLIPKGVRVEGRIPVKGRTKSGLR